MRLIIVMYNYHSVLGKSPLQDKHSDSYFAGVNENTTLRKHVFTVVTMGRYPSVQNCELRKGA